MRAAPPPARKPGTKRYMGLLKADRDTEAGVMPDETLHAAMGAFLEEGMKSGIFLPGEGLQPSSQAARVRFSGKERMVTDGPFAETKELVAGYAILQFASPAEALGVDQTIRASGRRDCWARKASANCGQLWSADRAPTARDR